MISPFIICYANNKNIVSDLKFGIIQVFGDSTSVSCFSNEYSFIESITTNKPENKSQLIIISTDEIKNPAVFIHQILNLTPEAYLLITGNIRILLNIQEENKLKSNLLYLPTPYNPDSLELSLRMIKAFMINRNGIMKAEKRDVNIEEKVNESLQKLIDANMAKDQFLSIIAHDLKSPFQVLLGVTDILMNDWDHLDEENKMELIGDIRRTSNETFKLLSNLLDWTRGQKEKLQITIKEVNIRDLVESVLNITGNHVKIKGIKVQNEISSNLKVNTDEQMIATVFRNLISNAVQYIQPGGKIQISALENINFTTFCIADNGYGIEKSYVLEYFNKGNNKKLNGNSTAFKGLGLLICKEFVEKNGGEIWLETQKGEGSKFFFTLPN